MSNHLTRLKMSKPRSKTKKVSHLINNVSFSLVNSSKMAVLFQTTVSPVLLVCARSSETKRNAVQRWNAVLGLLFESNLFQTLFSDFLTLVHFCVCFSDIQKEATLHLVLRLRGGGKKRKKKTYTKPKKIKHKHKNVKLAVLKYYKVDGDKVERLRKSCPQEGCGPGILMAQHYDRLYCGKCHYRIVVADE